MMRRDTTEPRTERRNDYVVFLAIPTRWTDADAQGRIGDAAFHVCFSTVVHACLIRECGWDLQGGSAGIYAVETTCRFHRTLRFPEIIDAGLRIGELGNAAVRFEIGLFRQGEDKPAATGHVVYVFAERETDKPMTIPDHIRAGLVKLVPRP